jgi:hypothetical protein
MHPGILAQFLLAAALPGVSDLPLMSGVFMICSTFRSKTVI